MTRANMLTTKRSASGARMTPKASWPKPRDKSREVAIGNSGGVELYMTE